MKKDDFVKLSYIFGSPKRTAILVLVDNGVSEHLEIVKEMKRNFNIVIHSSETYKHLHKLEKLDMVEHINRKWKSTHFGHYIVNIIENIGGKEYGFAK